MADLPIVYKIRSAIQNGTVADAVEVEFDNSNATGILNTATNLQTTLQRLDATGVGTPLVDFTGNFAAGATNIPTWFNDLARNHLRSVDATNGNRTFDLPGTNALNTVFDTLSSQGLPETFTLQITVEAGSAGSSLTANSLTVRARVAPSPQLADRTSVVLGYGQTVVVQITRTGGVLGSYDVIEEGVRGSSGPPGSSSMGDVVLRSQMWDASENGLLPTSSQVETGYAFRVVNAPTDGTGRFNEPMLTDDWVVWTGTTFTSWDAEPHQWFVIAAHDVRRITQNESNFLGEISEIDTGIVRQTITNTVTEVLFYFTPALFADAPTLTPSTDTNNPRPGQTEEYVGGRDITSDGVFEDTTNSYDNFYLYLSIDPTYVTANLSDIRIRIDNANGSQHFDFSLEDDFTAATFDGASLNYYYLAPNDTALTVGYGVDQQVYAYIGTSSKTFQFSDNVNVTRSVRNLGESALDADTRAKLNKQIALDRDDRTKLDNITETTTTGTAAVYQNFLYKTGGASVDTSEYRTGSYLIPGFTTTVVYTVLLPDTHVITSLSRISGSSGSSSFTQVTPSVVVGRNQYTITLTNGNDLWQINAAETTVSQLALSELFVITEDNLNDAIERKLDNTYTLPTVLKKIDASANIEYSNGQNYVSQNQYITNHNSFVILKDTPADGATVPGTGDISSFNQINGSGITLENEGNIRVPDANGNGGISDVSIPFTGSGLEGGYIKVLPNDSDNPNILVGAWINTNKMQEFDHSTFIRVREHGGSTFRTIASFNDYEFSLHVGNEDSTAGTPRNIRHYQSVYQSSSAVDGAISATFNQGQTAGFEVAGAGNWTIFLTLFQDDLEFATDSFVYNVANGETDQPQTTTSIGFDNGNDPIISITITTRFDYFYNNGYHRIVYIGSTNLAANQSIRAEVYNETANADRSGSDLTLSRVNIEGWGANFYGIHKVALLFGVNSLGTDFQVTVSVDGTGAEVIDMRYPYADLDYSDFVIGTTNGFRGRVQNIQGAQFINATPTDRLPTEAMLLDWTKNHDRKTDIMWNQFQAPNQNVERIIISEGLQLDNQIFTAPNGNQYRLSVDDTGNLVTTLI